MTDLIRSLAESFKNNLIAEDRYRMILDGLQVTLLITLCAAGRVGVLDAHEPAEMAAANCPGVY